MFDAFGFSIEFIVVLHTVNGDTRLVYKSQEKAISAWTQYLKDGKFANIIVERS